MGGRRKSKKKEQIVEESSADSELSVRSSSLKKKKKKGGKLSNKQKRVKFDRANLIKRRQWKSGKSSSEEEEGSYHKSLKYLFGEDEGKSKEIVNMEPEEEEGDYVHGDFNPYAPPPGYMVCNVCRQRYAKGSGLAHMEEHKALFKFTCKKGCFFRFQTTAAQTRHYKDGCPPK